MTRLPKLPVDTFRVVQTQEGEDGKLHPILGAFGQPIPHPRSPRNKGGNPDRGLGKYNDEGDKTRQARVNALFAFYATQQEGWDSEGEDTPSPFTPFGELVDHPLFEGLPRSRPCSSPQDPQSEDTLAKYVEVRLGKFSEIPC